MSEHDLPQIPSDLDETGNQRAYNPALLWAILELELNGIGSRLHAPGRLCSRHAEVRRHRNTAQLANVSGPSRRRGSARRPRGSPSRTRRSGSGVRPSGPIGADAARLRHLVMQQVGPITLAGVGVGLPGAVWLGQLARALLYEIDSLQLGLLASVALTAGLIPAQRASCADPMVALREQ